VTSRPRTGSALNSYITNTGESCAPCDRRLGFPSGRAIRLSACRSVLLRSARSRLFADALAVPPRSSAPAPSWRRRDRDRGLFRPCAGRAHRWSRGLSFAGRMIGVRCCAGSRRADREIIRFDQDMPAVPRYRRRPPEPKASAWSSREAPSFGRRHDADSSSSARRPLGSRLGISTPAPRDESAIRLDQHLMASRRCRRGSPPSGCAARRVSPPPPTSCRRFGVSQRPAPLPVTGPGRPFFSGVEGAAHRPQCVLGQQQPSRHAW